MWYPGHIEKAKKNIQKHLKIVDAIVELVDARIPYTSRAYEYEKLFGNKQRILVLNKEDLADPAITSRWQKYFLKGNVPILKINLKSADARRFLTKKVFPLIKSRYAEKRIMIVGIPNVGKSTFINRLKGKKSLVVGNTPGVTRGVQWITVSKQLMVLDTPGILYTRLHSPSIITKLAAVGSLPLEKLDILEAFRDVFTLLTERYGTAVLSGLIDINTDDPFEFLENFTEKRRFLQSRGELNLERGAFAFLRELANGKFGRFSYETPEEIEQLVSQKKEKQ
ncbi:ribosome biogenesis GTPase YlqF [Kosmotoga olearia]|uniref:Ribosome biogenesis GTPase A n=1 Tax=Kosmotoga olearia (strain ATCC BAA-1733 / DSM 21960 / TBF 19.5.1) TaxID=521045 RepID=C5CGX3_KOSOT|nr:ribosome biogenesis GTPase YlqF [Kosmotoga olearia]ACR79638.1 GTP-binding protein HSR1-related [Kosmotoga olearia TBF 19.5.1]MDK2953092.1 ribosome biosis GTPase [Kosmotoga sp.]